MFAVWTVMSCRAPQGQASVFGRLASSSTARKGVSLRQSGGGSARDGSVCRSPDGKLDPVDRQARYLINHSPR